MSLVRGEFNFLTTDHPMIVFEDNEVGRLKKEVFDAGDEEIDAILKEYEVPSPPELGKGGAYIQTTPRAVNVQKRRKNDIVLVPVGTTENHGDHANSGLDTFMASQICEAVRRYTKKQGHEVNLALPPLNYGGHPYHHMGMPGTIMVPQEVVTETLIYVMLGLWNDGYRKIIIVNNHGQLWMLETALQEFCKRFQLPGIYRVMDWHRAVREFFIPVSREDSL
ncbi:MAG: creatininase family protein, partial [Spirochaetota bacterium]|nr:creatininase family protein [Spirochaetota bacterium]